MDQHQRRVWGRMLERLDAYESGEVGLRKLLADLRGLLEAADLHDQRVIDEFCSYFAPLEGSTSADRAVGAGRLGKRRGFR